MIKIGVLGDIGSGKSFVAKQFGCPVFNADKEVSQIYKNDKLCIKIDVEGHELSVLKGLAKNLKQNKCIILVESGDVKFGVVNDFLIKNNYKQIFKSRLRLDYVYSNF